MHNGRLFGLLYPLRPQPRTKAERDRGSGRDEGESKKREKEAEAEMERGGGGRDDPLSWRGKQKQSSMIEEAEMEETESPAASSPDPFARAVSEPIGIRDEGPGYYPWAGLSSDFSIEREAWLEMRDRDPGATYRADVRRNDEALQRMQSKVLAAEYSRQLLQEYGQQSSECTFGGPCSPPDQQHQSTFQPGSWPGEQQQSADSTFELDTSSGSWPEEQQHSQDLVPGTDLQPGQQQYVAHLPSDSDPTSWPGEQPRSEPTMPGLVLKPGEQQQPADSAFELDPSSNMLQTEDFTVDAAYEVDITVEELLQLLDAEANNASRQQHPGHSSSGPSSPHGEPQHSIPSSSPLGSLPASQQHAECLMPGPGSQRHSVHPEPGPSSQSGQQEPLPPSSSAGEQQHLDPAAAGCSLPTQQQNSGRESVVRPTGEPGKWQLDGCLGWMPVPFPKELLPAKVSRPQMQRQRSSSQPGDRRHPVAYSSQPGDRRHPVAYSSQPDDRRHPVAYSSQPGDRRHPVAYSSQPGDRRHPVAYSSQPGDRRHPVAYSSHSRDRRLPPLSSQPGDRRRHPVASSLLHGELQHSTPSSSPPGSLSGEQQHAECLMPGPSPKSSECPHSASKADEPPSGSQQHSVLSEPGPSSQAGRQEPLPPSPSAGEQQHLDPAAAGSSLPTEQQNSDNSWNSIARPTRETGMWQLDDRFGWVPVPFPKDLLPAEVSWPQMQRPISSSQPGDRRHPVGHSSQPRDHQLPPLSPRPGERRHPVGHSSQPRDHQLPSLSSRPGAGRRPPPSVGPPQWDRLTPDYKPQRRSGSQAGYQQNSVGSNEQQPASSSQPDDHQHPAIVAQPDQQQQDEAHPISSSAPSSEAGDRQDSAHHPHAPRSQLDHRA